MYIESLKVTNLHKIYNYDVKFNKDITILYGENGSGKTTLLSILESILTAKVWELFEFDFEEVLLQSNKSFSISVRRGIDKEKGLYLELSLLDEEGSGKSDKIFQNVINSLNSSKYYTRYNSDIASAYPTIPELKKIFNDLYLPVNRLTHSLEEFERPSRYSKSSFKNNPDIDSSLELAIELISRENIMIDNRKNHYNQEFKNQILSSSLDTSTEDWNSIVNEEILNPKSIDELQIKYLKMLENLGISDNRENIELFFKEYKKKLPDILGAINKETEKDGDVSSVEVLNFLVGALEIKRMKKVLPIAEDLEKKLSGVSKKIDNFTDIINDFFENSMEKKEIVFDNFGRPYFKINNHNGNIPLKFLSSGEKQIVILFAHLILTRNYAHSKIFRDIFISDEPEISLHMLWQMKLIPNILKSRKKLQIIIATHSPEIVGEFENKMFELKKERAKNE